MAEVIGVSEAQLRFVTNTASGNGTYQVWSVVIPLIIRLVRIQICTDCIIPTFMRRLQEQKKREMQNNVE